MTEPITVADALRALRMLKELGEKATPDWRADEIGHSQKCPAILTPKGDKLFDVRGWGYLTGFLGMRKDKAMDAQGANMRFAVAARAVLPEMVEYWLNEIERRDAIKGQTLRPEFAAYHVIAPIVEWARNQEGWTK